MNEKGDILGLAQATEGGVNGLNELRGKMSELRGQIIDMKQIEGAIESKEDHAKSNSGEIAQEAQTESRMRALRVSELDVDGGVIQVSSNSRSTSGGKPKEKTVRAGTSAKKKVTGRGAQKGFGEMRGISRSLLSGRKLQTPAPAPKSMASPGSRSVLFEGEIGTPRKNKPDATCRCCGEPQ